MTLIPLAMIALSADCIYAPSRLRQPKEIETEEFIKRYADHPRRILVSFEADGLSEPQMVTAYGVGLSCWWMVSLEE